MIEQRLGETVALLLLTGGEDDRCAGELGVVEGPERVAETGRDVVLAVVPLDRLATLIAVPVAGGTYRFDVVVQGAGETVFFDV